MALHKGRRVVALCVLAGVAVVGVWAYFSRAKLLETWWLFRLESSALETKRDAVQALEDVGADRSAAPLLRLGGDEDLAQDAIRSLQAVSARVRPSTRVVIVRGLLALVEKSSGDLLAVLATAVREAGKEPVDLLPVFFDALESKRHDTRALATSGIFQFWETERDAVEEILRDAPPEKLLALLLAAHLPPQQRFLLANRSVPEPSFDAGVEIARWLGEHRADPEARALAMSLQVFRGRKQNDFEYDMAPVARGFEADASPLVRTAAIRISGFLGNRPGGPDLTGALFAEGDPVLLTEIVQARSLWAAGPPSWRHSLELWDGFACGWIPGSSDRTLAKPWEKVELDRLQHILETSTDPGLRDACSLALASRFRTLRDRKTAPKPVRVPGLRVHEWGVWVEGAEAILPAEKILEDLPAFVHRSEVSGAEIYAQRFYSPVFVTKPVVFFYTPEPLSLLVKVGFHGGRPWTFYPAATDYTEGVTGTAAIPIAPARASPPSGPPSRGAPWASALVDEGGPRSVAGRARRQAAVAARGAVAPPWLKAPAAGAATSGQGGDVPSYPDPAAANPEALRPFYTTVPWLIPNHPLLPTVTGGGGLGLSSMGLEWCGLRVGHAAAREADEPAVDPASWWARLREVPSSPVALRGESERFLFYDGALDMPGPLRVSWSNEEKRELLLLPRPFEEFPSGGSTLRMWWLSDAEKGRLRTTLPVPAVLVVSREKGKETRGAVLEALTPDAEPTPVPLVDLDLGEGALLRRLATLLEEEGLSREEARSLVETWKADFFRTPGLRVITILPQWMFDVLVPLEVYPVPEETVRVGLVWKECDGIEVGTSSWGLLSADERWRPKPWKMPRQDVELRRDAFTPGDTRPLEIEASGEILENGKPGGSGLAFSADGSIVAFQLLDGSTSRILRASLRERWVQEVTRFEVAGMKHPGAVAISADGERIAFSVQLPGSGWTSFLLDLPERVQIELPRGGTPMLSGDGKKVLYTVTDYQARPRRQALMLLDVDTETVQTLFDDDLKGLLSTRDLSGDGTKAAFAFGWGHDVNDLEVYLVDLVEETVLNISRSAEDDRNPRLSHDGQRILFESTRTRDKDIILVDLAQQTLTNVTLRPGDDRFPEITADGKRMVYRDWDAETFYFVDLETGAKRRIPGTERVWSTTLSPDGSRIALVKWRDRTPYLSIEDLEPLR